MTEKTSFIPYRPKTILNSHKRADHWFWSRYSAYPYVGCQHGCKFCYSREEKYAHNVEPDNFDQIIKVKENAAELLRHALSRKPVDIIFLGDYQPAEKKFGLTRQMLEVCRDMGFPVFMLSRSPLVLRDLDILQEINRQSTATVAFSVISTPDSPNHSIAVQMENHAPHVEGRFTAMREISRAGMLTGTCFMPILPGVCDDDANLEAVVRLTAENGGQFVLAGGLTLADQQKDYFFNVIREQFPAMLPAYSGWYPSGSYAPVRYDWNRIALRIRELCAKFGIRDRIPRPVISGDKFALNKRVVEHLAEKVYELEISGAANQRIWEYRKAAWAIEDLQIDLRLIYSTLGLKGILSIPNLSERIAVEVGEMVDFLCFNISTTTSKSL